MNTRERILENALKLFSRKGYLGATTKDIAKASGVAEVTLFRHFSSKEKLFEEAIRSRSFIPALESLLPEARKMNYEDALRLIAERFLESLSAKKDLIRIMSSEMHRYPEEINSINRSFLDGLFKSMARYFEGLRKAGVLRDIDSRLAARAFLGMFFSYFNANDIMMYDRSGASGRRKIIRGFTDIFINGTIKNGD